MTADDTLKGEHGVEVRTYFVREKNALVARADFAPLFVEYYLHLNDCRIQRAPPADALLRDALAAVTLHCASRPWHETTAWTIHFPAQSLNLFVTGNSENGTVVGNVLTENIKPGTRNQLHVEVFQKRAPHRRSAIEFDGLDILGAVEQFYRQSEQRPARLFRLTDEDVAMVTAQPDCDTRWFESLTTDAMRTLDQSATLRLLEQRRYRFACGCTQSRLLTALAPMLKADPAELFGAEESLTVTCPRCGARHRISRETLEAWRSERG